MPKINKYDLPPEMRDAPEGEPSGKNQNPHIDIGEEYQKEQKNLTKMYDEVVEESFPASDPPPGPGVSYNVAPKKVENIGSDFKEAPISDPEQCTETKQPSSK